MIKANNVMLKLNQIREEAWPNRATPSSFKVKETKQNLTDSQYWFKLF